MDELKRRLRASTLAARRAITDGERASASERVAERVLTRPDVLMAEAVLLYAATDDEVATAAIDAGLRRRGVEVSYPRVTGDRLETVLVEDVADLAVGAFGVREPVGEATDDDVDVIIVPGVAFDLRGGRLGHGGGHYDRLLAEIPGAVRIGLAFSAQLVLRVPMADHDQPLDLLITEHAAHVTGARSGPLEA